LLTDVKNKHYKNNLSMQAVRKAAGLRGRLIDGGGYFNPLVECDEHGQGPAPPEFLTHMIFEGWDTLIRAWQADQVLHAPTIQICV